MPPVVFLCNLFDSSATQGGYNECHKIPALALGNFLTCAAIMVIDPCLKERFKVEGYDTVPGFADKGLTTAVICPICKYGENPF